MKWQSHPQHPTLAYRFCLNLLTGACTTLTDRFLLILTDMYLFRKTIFILTFASARQFHSCFHARVIFSLYNAIFLLTSRQKFFDTSLNIRSCSSGCICRKSSAFRSRCADAAVSCTPAFIRVRFSFRSFFSFWARVCAAAPPNVPCALLFVPFPPR